MAKTTTASSVAVAAAAATRPVFYTRDKAAVKVALWKNTRSTKGTAPVLVGTIDKKQVAGFLRQGPKGKFIQLTGVVKLENGFYEDMGTARVVAGSQGYPKLVIDQKVWADTTKEGTAEFLASLGLDVDKMMVKQGEMAQAREAAKDTAAA